MTQKQKIQSLRRVGLVLSVATMLLLAGCSGGGGSGQATVEPSGTVTDTATPTKTTSSPQSNSLSGFATNYADSDGTLQVPYQSKDLTPDQVTYRNLTNTTTYEWKVTHSDYRGDDPVNRSDHYIKGKDTALRYSHDTGDDEQYYYIFGSTKGTLRVINNDGSIDSVYRTAAPDELPYKPSYVEDLFKYVTFTFDHYSKIGTGEKVAVFTTSGTTTKFGEAFGAGASYEGKVMIDKAGVVRSGSVTITNSSGAVVWAHAWSLSGFNSTTVQEPSWHRPH